MSSSDSSDDSDSAEAQKVRRDIEAEAGEITTNLAPSESVERYRTCYNTFIRWKNANAGNVLNENVLLVFFKDLMKTLAPSTIWSRWSMLKTMININHDININKYTKLKTLIKNFARGHIPKKSKVLSWDLFKKFVNEAPDFIYLANKVIAIFGVSGAMRGQEICDLAVQDVEDTGNQMIVTIHKTKNKYPRTFVIGPEFREKIHQYQALRPKDARTDRFFLQYHRGVCNRQVIGKNSIAQTPKTMAIFLNLPDAEKYTGHCLRRTSTTLLADSGASLLTIKQHGGWKSDTVATGYIENSLANKRKIFDQIISADHSLPKSTHPIQSIRETPSNSTCLPPTTTHTITSTMLTSSNLICSSPTTQTLTSTSTKPSKSDFSIPVVTEITATKKLTAPTTTATTSKPDPETQDSMSDIDLEFAMDYPKVEPIILKSTSISGPKRPNEEPAKSSDSKRKQRSCLQRTDLQNILKAIPDHAQIKIENCNFEIHIHCHGCDKENQRD